MQQNTLHSTQIILYRGGRYVVADGPSGSVDAGRPMGSDRDADRVNYVRKNAKCHIKQKNRFPEYTLLRSYMGRLKFGQKEHVFDN